MQHLMDYIEDEQEVILRSLFFYSNAVPGREGGGGARGGKRHGWHVRGTAKQTSTVIFLGKKSNIHIIDSAAGWQSIQSKKPNSVFDAVSFYLYSNPVDIHQFYGKFLK